MVSMLTNLYQIHNQLLIWEEEAVDEEPVEENALKNVAHAVEENILKNVAHAVEENHGDAEKEKDTLERRYDS